jgi:hypothetical protein
MINFNNFNCATIDQQIKSKIHDVIQSWHSEHEKTMHEELKSFFDYRFGQNCWTNSFVKNRGEFLYYRACNKTEFVFDAKIVFSLLLKTDMPNPCVEVIRYYKKESESC